jgi:hypothetical protein
MKIKSENDRFLCADCGTELEKQPGKQYRDADEPISKTQAAYVMFCRTCDSPKGEWGLESEREAALSEIRKAG